MKICLVGSILRQTIHSPSGDYNGWGGMTESAVAPFAALLDKNSVIHFVGSLGEEDMSEVKEFFRANYPIVDPSGVFVNPTGTDSHHGTKDFVKVKVRVEPTRYENIEPYIKGVDVVIFNFGNIDDIDPEAIKKTKENSNALIYVDIHRKPFGADEEGYIYSRGWEDWEQYLKYADVVQMNKNECEALFRKEHMTIADIVFAAGAVLDAGAKRVVITLRDQGAMLATHDAPYSYLIMPPVPARAVRDLSGCGDAFAAGYLTALIEEHKSPEDALKLANLIASINCEFVGYIKGMDRAAIEARMPKDLNAIVFDPKHIPPINFDIISKK